MKFSYKKLSVMISVCLAVCMLMSAASACTTIYVGSALTADGSTIFGRSEDFSNSQNKLFYVAEGGKHAAGEEYAGCYGFTWTFTHDSYGYTAFSDDNGDGVGGICPDCDGDHAHTPYEAALELLCGIYDDAGANNGSGIIIADANEAWYVENVTGHQYIAVKLSDDMVMMQPNMVIIGEIDLDDTENVFASAGLIETAVAAGTFVGDQDQNIINYVESYGGGTQANARMKDGLSWLTGGSPDDEATYAPAVYLITNLDENGGIAAMHTGITLNNGKLSIDDVQAFYNIPSIGYVRNLETHVFQIFDDTATGTVEWVAMNDTALSVFVPYLPMLTTDTFAPYKLSTAAAPFVEEEPEEGVYYATTTYRRVDGERVPVEGFKVLPENWADSMYWVNDAVSNLVMYGDLTEEQIDAAYAAVYAQQAAINAAFAGDKASWTDAETATAGSMAYAEETYKAALELANSLIGE